MSSSAGLSTIAEVVGPILAQVPAEHRPLLIALAERMAADRYRSWAEASSEPGTRASLLACAAREDEIASRVEALYPAAAATQAALRAANPELEDLGERIFAKRDLREQFAIQAQGERGGAATWRAFAKDAEPEAQQAFHECASLEEANAEVLEALLRSD